MDRLIGFILTQWEWGLTVARPMIFEPLRQYAVAIHLLVLACCVALVWLLIRLSTHIVRWVQTYWWHLLLGIGGLLLYWNFSANYMPAEFALGPQLPANRLIAAPLPHAPKRQLPAVIIVDPVPPPLIPADDDDDDDIPLQVEPEEEGEDIVEKVIELVPPPPPPPPPPPAKKTKPPPPSPPVRRRRP